MTPVERQHKTLVSTLQKTMSTEERVLESFTQSLDAYETRNVTPLKKGREQELEVSISDLVASHSFSSKEDMKTSLAHVEQAIGGERLTLEDLDAQTGEDLLITERDVLLANPDHLRDLADRVIVPAARTMVPGKYFRHMGQELRVDKWRRDFEEVNLVATAELASALEERLIDRAATLNHAARLNEALNQTTAAASAAHMYARADTSHGVRKESVWKRSNMTVLERAREREWSAFIAGLRKYLSITGMEVSPDLEEYITVLHDLVLDLDNAVGKDSDLYVDAVDVLAEPPFVQYALDPPYQAVLQYVASYTAVPAAKLQVYLMHRHIHPSQPVEHADLVRTYDALASSTGSDPDSDHEQTPEQLVAALRNEMDAVATTLSP